MPKYVYYCCGCSTLMELFHPIGDKPSCPQCLSGSLERDYNQGFKRLSVGDGFVFSPKIGDLTKKFIEENREVLKEIKENVPREIKK